MIYTIPDCKKFTVNMTKNNIIGYSLSSYNNYMHSIQMFEKRDHKIGHVHGMRINSQICKIIYHILWHWFRV